jgi:GTP cyclohydrolase I
MELMTTSASCARGDDPEVLLPSDGSAVMTSRCSVSERVRQRLRAAGQRFHANDNIADYLQEGELDDLQCEAGIHLERLLRSLVIDVDGDPDSRDTASRVAKMIVTEVFSDRFAPMPALTSFPNVARIDDMIVVGPLAVRSTCSDDLCPVAGKLWIGLVPAPGTELAGLSKYVRLADRIMQRAQAQEEALNQLAEALLEMLKPAGVALKMCADHQCMQLGGVCEHEAHKTSVVMRGAFLDQAALRSDFLMVGTS